ncbi:MAG: hypothetical protein IPO21_17250 [Bacteroidales bacterium]|nr:hypothetical protein [Bacteroidales bacterium]
MNLLQKGWITIIKCFIVPCEKATYLETKRKFEKLTFREKINLNMHMMKCSYCRVFRTEQEFLSKCISTFKDNIEKDKLVYVLPNESISKMEQTIAANEK